MKSDGAGFELFKCEDGHRKARLYERFPAKVRGVDAGGDVFEIDAVLENLGAGGLSLWLARAVEPGTRLSILIRLGCGPAAKAPPHVAVNGTVLRSEPQPDGRCRIELAFQRSHLQGGFFGALPG